MNYLLDTHIVLWWLNDSKKLKPSIRTIITTSENNIFTSSASIWEISIKRALGKLKAPENTLEKINESDFQLLSVTARQAWQVQQLPFHHKDPFDRLLIAQAQLEHLSIITADHIFQKYSVSVVLA